MPMHTTAAINQKGGVGKSGLIAGTAGALMERGRRVLVVDFCPQGHLTTEAFQLPEAPAGPDQPNLANALTGDYTGSLGKLVVQHSTHPSGGELWVLPTTLDMFLLVRALYARVKRMEFRLADLLDALALEFEQAGMPIDHALVDCTPSLDVLTDNALVAAGALLIPVEPDKTSIRALTLLLGQINSVEAELRLPQRQLLGLVPSVYRRPLAGIDKYVMAQLEDLESSAGLPIVAQLPLTTKVKEAWLHGKPVTIDSPDAAISVQYRRVAVRVDVAAGLAGRDEWNALPALPRESGRDLDTDRDAGQDALTGGA